MRDEKSGGFDGIGQGSYEVLYMGCADRTAEGGINSKAS